MSAAMLTQLLIMYGPQAIEWIIKLATLWNKESLTVEEVTEITGLAKKSYEQYIAEAKARVTFTPVP